MQTIGLTGIVPFNYFGEHQKMSGSTSLRVDSLVECAPDFEKWVHGRRYDNIIFQKAYWKEMMDLFAGPKILDLCDPDWINGTPDIIEVGKSVDAITCSSHNLTLLMKRYFPGKLIAYIPDRLNFSAFPSPRSLHRGQAKRVVWFGFIRNAHETLEQLLPSLRKHKLELHIISDKPYTKDDGISRIDPEFIRYNNDTAYHVIKTFDMVLNPISDKAFFKYKSNNKTVIGWKLGLPVAITNDDIERFMDPEQRNKEVQRKRVMVDREYNIVTSAEEYRAIIGQVKERTGSVVVKR